MKLDRVTMTGADDSIGDPSNLVELTAEFPFVEWGILASAGHAPVGGARFPSDAWLHRLKELSCKWRLPLSLHLCGRWVRELLKGDVTIPPFLIEGGWFPRVQLNFHAERTLCKPREFYLALLSLGKRQYIFQIDGANGNEHLESLGAEDDGEHDVDAVALFDISGGAGVLPSKWPEPIYMDNDVDHSYHGYAGGLGPENIEQQLPLIAAAAGNTRIWIDMETRVRSDGDRKFDLTKVRRVLETCAPHVRREPSLASAS